MVLQILYYHPPKKKYQFLFHWTDFYEIWYSGSFQKLNFR
jgi:hypothetical protein